TRAPSRARRPERELDAHPGRDLAAVRRAHRGARRAAARGARRHARRGPMSLAPTRELLDAAVASGGAVAGFNVITLEHVEAIARGPEIGRAPGREGG